MKARIMETSANLYEDKNLDSTVIAELVQDDEVEIADVVKNKGIEWSIATWRNGMKGYLSGNTRIYHIKNAGLLQRDLVVYAEPSDQSSVAAE